MSPRLADRISAARERAAEQRDREERLPRAICAACGGIVALGEGVGVAESPWAADADAWRVVDAERATDGLAPIVRWRRRHDGCADAARIAHGILGVEIPADVAGLALSALAMRPMGEGLLARHRGPSPHTADGANRDRNPRPWAHITNADRAALVRAIQKARAQTEARPCSQGACGWCGIARAIGWRSSPERWPDSSPAPLCGHCADVWDLRGNPTDDDALRACALESLSGAAVMLGRGIVAGKRMLRFCEVATEDHGGHAEAWAYAPEPLEAIREAARLAWPFSLPPDLRDEYEPRAWAASVAALEATRAAAAAEADAAREAERAELAAQGWPVG